MFVHWRIFIFVLCLCNDALALYPFEALLNINQTTSETNQSAEITPRNSGRITAGPIHIKKCCDENEMFNDNQKCVNAEGNDQYGFKHFLEGILGEYHEWGDPVIVYRNPPVGTTSDYIVQEEDFNVFYPLTTVARKDKKFLYSFNVTEDAEDEYCLEVNPDKSATLRYLKSYEYCDAQHCVPVCDTFHYINAETRKKKKIFPGLVPFDMTNRQQTSTAMLIMDLGFAVLEALKNKNLGLTDKCVKGYDKWDYQGKFVITTQRQELIEVENDNAVKPGRFCVKVVQDSTTPSSMKLEIYKCKDPLESPGLPGWAIAVVVIVALIGLCVIALLLYFGVKYLRKSSFYQARMGRNEN